MGEINPYLMPGTECVSSANGYYTDECFEKYIDFLLDESKGGIPNDGRWRILIVDGYGSHTMVPSVLQKLSDRKIWMITMPSHTCVCSHWMCHALGRPNISGHALCGICMGLEHFIK